MAYVSQDEKKELAVGIKRVLKKYNVKGTIGVDNHSTLVVRLRSGDLDILGNYWEVYNTAIIRGQIDPWNTRSEKPTYIQVNRHCLDSSYSGDVLNFLTELVAKMKGEKYFNDSDPMTDYFHCSHYIEIAVGNWEKPYVYNGELAEAA
tara:strand:+ start:95133 stop:95576 length:444 start_codon:yes stop_codon:yes gene_type:complete